MAGSYENEVLAVRVLLDALRDIRRAAAPHHRLELDVARASGAFPLAFLDGACAGCAGWGGGASPARPRPL